MKLTRRHFFGTTAAALPAVAYTRVLEPGWLERCDVDVGIAGGKLKGEIRVLHLSDFHASPCVSPKLIDGAITMGLEARPDIAVLTGDFITDRLRDEETFGKSLEKLSAQVPTFACMGNHDGGAWAFARGSYKAAGPVVDFLKGRSITVLVNESRLLYVRGNVIQLIGLADLWSGDFATPEPFYPAPNGFSGARIVLAHNPDSKDRIEAYPWDLMLSGHTHGGQITLPFLGAIFAPVQDFRFIKGLHAWSGRQLHITKGIGNLHGIRFNCRPEVSVLNLKPI